MSINAEGENSALGHGFYDVPGSDVGKVYGSAQDVLYGESGLFEEADARVQAIVAREEQATIQELNGHYVPVEQVLGFYGLRPVVEVPLPADGSAESPAVRP